MTAPTQPKVVTTSAVPGAAQQSPPRQAPATPSQSPFVVKARELEAQIAAEANQRQKEKSARRHALEAQLADLQKVEAMRYSGANPRTPMGEIQRRALVAAAEQNPDLHVRIVDESKEGRVDYLQSRGYTKISEGAGGKQMGRSALYGIPRERYGELEAAKRLQSASQLRGTKSEMEQTVANVIEELNQRGYDLSPRDIIIDED